MIDTVLIVEDDSFFIDILSDALYYEDFNSRTKVINYSDEAEEYYKELLKTDKKPDCIIVDMDLVGSSFDGIELVRRINFVYGNDVVVGICSESEKEEHIARCLKVGALFYIMKTDNILPRIRQLKLDYKSLKNRSMPFKIYK